MPTLAGWFIVGVPALYLLLFSVRTAVTVDPATKTLRTSTTMLLVLPIHSSRREFSDTRFVRIGLSGAVAESLGASAAGCLTGAVKMVVTFTLFGIWGYLFYRLMDDGSPEPPRGQPLAQIVFEDRDAWVIARGSESHVEERATLAARLIGVRLGG
jgi:hypothetical protein